MADNMRDLEALHNVYDPSIDNRWMVSISDRIKENKWKTPDSIYQGSFYEKSALKYIHFPHIDPDDANRIRFIDGIKNGRKDRMSSMRIGRYLTKYFGKSIGSEGQILQLQQQVVYETAPVDVKFAVTPDEIEFVYSNGPRSCMSKPVHTFQVPEHPCRMYSAGDLQVAYVLNAEGTKPGGRTVVWPEKKHWVRIYGDTARLKRGLDDLGYNKVDGFAGARLVRTPYRNTFIVPYVDGGARYVQPTLDTESLVLRNHNNVNTTHLYYEIRSEWGWLSEPDRGCALCEENGAPEGHHPDEEIQHISFNDSEGNRGTMDICRSHLRDYREYGILRCELCRTYHAPHTLLHDHGTTVVCARCVRRGV